MDQVQDYEKHYETYNREGSVRFCQRETQTQTRRRGSWVLEDV